ncbi:hypothetical protein OBB02_00185 [Candidatus Puniceispirillum sp.]|nr:hypothetical protein [Candidatus Puniceispirillum sp.]
MTYSSKDPSKAQSINWPKDRMSDQNNTDNAWQRRAEMALATAQQANQTITYTELADAAAIPSPQRIHKLTEWLETSMRSDHAAGQPLRAALVISRSRSGLPAPGFFMLCSELGLYTGAASGQHAVQFHKTVITNLWQKSNP